MNQYKERIMNESFKEYIGYRGVSDTISVFDIDDTLFKTKSKVRYKEPGDKWKSVGTGDFADIRTKLHPDTEFDWSDFEKYTSIYSALQNSQPVMKVLKELDKAVIRGDKIGIITARGNQKAILDGLKSALVFRDSDGELKQLPSKQFRKKYVFAVGDSATAKALGKSGGSNNPSELKAEILQKIFGEKMGFKKIKFYDDDIGNIQKVKDLNDKRIEAILV